MLGLFLQETALPIDVHGPGGPLLLLVFLIWCVLGIGLFASAETALVGVNKLRIRTLAEKGHKGAQAVERLLAAHDKMFGTILLTGIMFTILASTLAGALAVHYLGESGTWIASFFMTGFIVIFAEIAPKTYAAEHAERMALLLARPIEIIMKLMHWPVKFVTAIAVFVVSLTGTRPTRTITQYTEDEIKLAVKEGALETKEKELIHGIFEFGDTVAREVMVPRVDMVCIHQNDLLEKALDLINETGHSRVPVYDENIDHIVGILHAKDLLLKVRTMSKSDVAADIMRRPVHFAPQGQKIINLLADMKAKRTSIAIVIDEYGGTAGLVTIEMLLEEIVGEIEDEFDVVENPQVEEPGKIRVVDARMPIDEVSEMLGVELPEGEYQSLGGFVTHHMGKIPSEGEAFEYKGIRFIVSKTHNYKLKTIQIQMPEEPSATEAA